MILCAIVLLAGAFASTAVNDLTNTDFDALHKLIPPRENDSQWMHVSWMPAADIWAVRKKAAAEGKPLFLWCMAGELLGAC